MGGLKTTNDFLLYCLQSDRDQLLAMDEKSESDEKSDSPIAGQVREKPVEFTSNDVITFFIMCLEKWRVDHEKNK